MFDSRLFRSAFSSVLGQDTEPQIAPDGCPIGVWMCLSSWQAGWPPCCWCVNGWMLTCVIKALWVGERLKKCCLNTVHLPFILSLKCFYSLTSVLCEPEDIQRGIFIMGFLTRAYNTLDWSLGRFCIQSILCLFIQGFAWAATFISQEVCVIWKKICHNQLLSINVILFFKIVRSNSFHSFIFILMKSAYQPLD